MAAGSSTAKPVELNDTFLQAPAKPRLRGVSHEVAAFVFPLMGVAAVLAARSSAEKVAVGIYTVGVTCMYATSACYHRVHWAPAPRSRMRRLDHSMILVAIASTYTPVAVMGLPATTARALLGVVWGLVIAGVLVRNLWATAPRWVMSVFYIGVGWTAVSVLPSLLAGLGVVNFALMLAGGAAYSLGALVLGLRRPDPAPAVFGYHEVFHALVVVAGLLFYLVVLGLITKG
ncbi:MAG TPA: hemolysin III family protein [Acidimicrobiales bacterium]|nr:hemolysin III family protein [Acidimicrobiales bacterium]